MFERFLATFVVLEREDPGSLGQEEWEKNGGGGGGNNFGKVKLEPKSNIGSKDDELEEVEYDTNRGRVLDT